MAASNQADVAGAASLFRLAISRTARTGPSGEITGAGVGSSIEFQDYREYTPGDDLRHVDWAAFARTDSLMIRLYRQEVSPTVEVVLDASRSMASDPDKARMASSLTALFLALATARGARPLLWLAADEITRITDDPSSALEANTFESESDLPHLLAACRPVFRNRSIRVVISDFLFPHNMEASLQMLSKSAASLWLIQVLPQQEDDPQVGGAYRFIDVETAEFRDVVLSEQAVSRYRDRLERLKASLSRATRRIHGQYVCVRADRPFLDTVRHALCPAGMVEAR